MPCSLGNPCGGQARLVANLGDALLYQCVNAHTLRVGAPAPILATRTVTPYRLLRKRAPCLRRRCVAYSTRSSPYCYAHRPK